MVLQIVIFMAYSTLIHR